MFFLIRRLLILIAVKFPKTIFGNFLKVSFSSLNTNYFLFRLNIFLILFAIREIYFDELMQFNDWKKKLISFYFVEEKKLENGKRIFIKILFHVFFLIYIIATLTINSTTKNKSFFLIKMILNEKKQDLQEIG